MTELALFLWALYIGVWIALLLDHWFEALREGRGRVPVLDPAWQWMKARVERVLRIKR